MKGAPLTSVATRNKNTGSYLTMTSHLKDKSMASADDFLTPISVHNLYCFALQQTPHAA
jgi:hypothetical protein